MNITTHRVAYFIQTDHNNPLQSIQKTLRLKFDKLILVSEDEKFIASAKSFFKSGEIIEVVPLRTVIPIGAVIIPSDIEAQSNLSTPYGEPLFKFSETADNETPELKIVHDGLTRVCSAAEIKKLLDANVIVDRGNGHYEIVLGKSWKHVDEILSPPIRHKPR